MSHKLAPDAVVAPDTKERLQLTLIMGFIA